MQSTFYLTKHSKSNFVRIATVEIIVGILSMVFELVGLIMNSDTGSQQEQLYLKLGAGIWCGASFIICGTCCLIAKRKASFSMMIISLVVAAVSIVFAVALLWINILQIQATSSALHVVLAIFSVVFLLLAGFQIGFGISTTCFVTSSSTSRRATVTSVEQTEATKANSGAFISRYHPSTLQCKGQLIVSTAPNKPSSTYNNVMTRSSYVSPGTQISITCH